MKEIQLAAMREARETLLIAAANFGVVAPSARDRCINAANALHEAYTCAAAPLLTHKAEDAPSDAELLDCCRQRVGPAANECRAVGRLCAKSS